MKENKNMASPTKRLGGMRFALWVLCIAALTSCQAGPSKPALASDKRQISELIEKYAESLGRPDMTLAAGEVWLQSPDVSFIHPRGHERGWEEIKRNFYENTMEAFFSERKLNVSDVSMQVFGEAAVAEFYWHFQAKLRKDSSKLETKGRETQVYRRISPNEWRLVHVHYSGMRVTGEGEGF
jgi:ketosteroid isomerase-like protein